MGNQKPINKGKILGIIIAVVAVLMIAMAGALWEDADKSKNYVCQMPVTGNYVVWTDGGYSRQEISPFSQYGVTCGLVSIIDIKYDAATQSQIDAQKQANLAIITSKTKSLEAVQRTLQITEDGKAAAEKAKWEQEKEKAVAVTKAQQEFEVAELEAKKAKQVALKVQAEGEAKAAANRALVAAGLTPAEKAEWDYKTAVGVAEALANSKVQWVPSVMFGGNGSGNNAMDAVGLKMLMDITKSFDKK